MLELVKHSLLNANLLIVLLGHLPPFSVIRRFHLQNHYVIAIAFREKLFSILWLMWNDHNDVHSSGCFNFVFISTSS